MAPALDIRRRTLSLFLGVSFFHIILISIQVQSKTGGPLAETAAFAVFARAESATAWAAGGTHWLWSRYVFLHGVVDQNQQQRDRIAQLEGQLQQERAVASETRALETALGLRQTLTSPSVVARVIAGDVSPVAMTITIDRGAADGVQTDMPVLAAQGVVGRVIGHPTPHASHVQLIIGRSAGAGALLERTGKGCVVVGGADNPPLRLELVENTVDVQPGDRVLTRGGDTVFPAGFVIGTVVRAQHGSGVYTEIAVKPAVDFSHLDIVVVLLQLPALPGGGL